MSHEHAPEKTYQVAPGFHYKKGGKISLGNIFKLPLDVSDVPLSSQSVDPDLGVPPLPPTSTVVSPDSGPEDGVPAPGVRPGEGGDSHGSHNEDTAYDKHKDRKAQDKHKKRTQHCQKIHDPEETPYSDHEQQTETPPPQSPRIVLLERRDRKWGLKGFAKFFDAAKAKISIKQRKDFFIAYIINKLKTEEFTGDALKAYIQSRVDVDPDLQRWLDAGKSAFMISGVAYSTGLEVRIIDGSQSETEADIRATLNQHMKAGLGGHGGSTADNERDETVLAEVIFAYQVVRIWYADKRTGEIDAQTYKSKAALLGDHDAPENREEEIE